MRSAGSARVTGGCRLAQPPAAAWYTVYIRSEKGLLLMKWIIVVFAALLLLAGCSHTPDPQSLAALEDVMAAAAVNNTQEEADATDTVSWDGEFISGDRSVTLSLDTDGSLLFTFSDDGCKGSAEISGSAAKNDTLHFSLSGDTLSVFGGSYTGNYQRLS